MTPPRRTTPGRDRLHEDRVLFERYARSPTPEQRDALVERFLPLARRLAARYARPREPLEDLVQVAALGLVKAVDRYDVERGIAFSSYAVPTIAGEIKRYYRDRTWAIRPPRDLQDLALAVHGARTELESRLGRPPTVLQIAERLDVPDEDVVEAINASSAQYATSLYQPVGSDQDGDIALIDLLAADDREVDAAEARAMLTSLLGVLPKRSRKVLLLRFEKDMTQSEIGEIVGISQMQVSRIIRQSLAMLRAVARDREREARAALAGRS